MFKDSEISNALLIPRCCAKSRGWRTYNPRLFLKSSSFTYQSIMRNKWKKPISKPGCTLSIASISVCMLSKNLSFFSSSFFSPNLQLWWFFTPDPVRVMQDYQEHNSDVSFGVTFIFKVYIAFVAKLPKQN